MNKQKSKKLNSKQKTIAVIALIVTVLLAICVTFAWYTNRINELHGLFSLGSFDYTITLYDVDASSKTLDERNTQQFDKQDTTDWSLGADPVQVGGWASDSVMYQLVKVENDADFGIKAYEYLTYNQMSAEETALANYFYFKPYKLEISGNASKSQIETYLSTYTLPSASDVASPSSDITFGTIKNNAVAFESGSVEGGDCGYYLIAYCVTGVPNELTFPSDLTVDVNPILTIGQANGPIPQTTSSSRIIYADSWQALRSAIASANSGDTIFLTKNIEGPASTNLSMTNGVNINLNTYNLTIHGDLVFNYKTTDARKLTVPSSSRLYVDGDIYVNTIGSFSINSTGSSANVFLGKLEDEEVTGGHLYVNARLSVIEDDPTDVDTTIINDSVGFTLNNIRLRSIDDEGDYVLSDLIVTGSDTMVKLSAGAALNSIAVKSGGLTDVYIVNNGEVDSIDLGNIDYSTGTLKVKAYVKNNNTVESGLSLKSGSTGAIGFKTNGTDYNTRVINGNGCATSFSGDYNAPYFMAVDIEPFNQSSDTSIVYENDRTNGVYTVYLKNVAGNTGSNYEAITDLFTNYHYDYTACKSLTIVTNNGIQLKPAQFYDIRDNFSMLEKVDLSSAAVAGREIPDNAFDATYVDAQAHTTSQMQNLSEVILPITSIDIGDDAFLGTRIAEITIGPNVNSIGSGAFHVAAGTSLEVIWDCSDSIPSTFLDGFDVNKTTIFMDESLAQMAMSSYSPAWRLNMYEFYDFKAENGTYYCKYSRDGSTATGCEIIYYAGTIASKEEDNLVPDALNDGQANFTVVAVKRQAFKKAIIADGGATSDGVIVNLSNCTSVGDSAFEGTSGAKLIIKPLTLGMVKEIGDSAFRNTTIINSAARPNGFGGMVSLGAYAFSGSSLTGGILDLHGPNERYSPSDYALSGFVMNGAYAGNTDTGNAILDLRNVNTFAANFAANAVLKVDVLLSNSNTIASGAFSGAIKGNHDPEDPTSMPTNIVDARDIRAIGQKAFFELECAVLKIGTNDSTLIDSTNPYQSIIGKTYGKDIGTLVLDGTFATGTAPAIASVDDINEMVSIGTLQIARVTDGNDVVTTLIPAYAFATNCTVSSGTFSGRNLHIGAINTGTSGAYASFNIGERAFFGTNFASSQMNFEGVIEIGSEAFAYSSIRNLYLGTQISYIAGENFIKYCDSIRRLEIATVLPTVEEGDPEPEYDEYVVELAGTAAANEKFSSTNTKVGTDADPFKIVVPTAILTTYLQQNLEIEGETVLNVWYGWRNYFEPLIHTYTSGNDIWEYYIIDSDDPDKGVQLVSYNYGGTQPGPNDNPIKVNAIVPSQINGLSVTEFGADEDILKNLNEKISVGFNFKTRTSNESISYISPNALGSGRILGFDFPNSANTRYYVVIGTRLSTRTGDYVLYRKTDKSSQVETEIVKVFEYTFTNTNGSTAYTWSHLSSSVKQFTVNENVSAIIKGAFSGNTQFTSIKVAAPSTDRASAPRHEYAPLLQYIESGAFENSKVTTFNLVNCFKTTWTNTDPTIKYSDTILVQIGRDAFGAARKKVLTPSGYYEYAKADDISIIVANVDVHDTSKTTDPLPLIDKYKNEGEFYLYEKYNCMSSATPDSRPTPSSLDEDAKQDSDTKASLKNKAFDVTIGGINYHVMESGSTYNEVTYKSDKAKMIAVVTGLSGDTADSVKVVIPSTITVKGVEYSVYAIADSAFGSNETLETLVLPNRELLYTSAALAGCTKLETIHYNDLQAYAESAQSNVASLPIESARSLMEDNSEETE